jgi:6,7-dimethyl-8-ribityllumazine synthase
VVVRGETPHFDYVAGETAAALGRAATDTLVPVGFGLLTCDTIDQALARAGGSAGNKGREAAEAALRTADLIRQALED